MSNDAWSLLDILKMEYGDLLQNNISPTQATIFTPTEITSKYNLDSEITDDLLKELNKNGYIELWITGHFVLKVIED